MPFKRIYADICHSRYIGYVYLLPIIFRYEIDRKADIVGQDRRGFVRNAFYAVIYGINWVLLAVVNNLALKTGPLSYTSVIISLSLVIPTFSGWLFWNEKINALQLIGIIFMIMCFVLSNEKSEDDKKAKKIWYVYVTVAFVSNGFCGIIQKLHQSSSGAEETTGFVFTALLISVVISTPLILFFKGKERKNRPSENSEGLKTGSKTNISFFFCF